MSALIGVGCMRVASAAPIVAALEAGATLLDTARAYGESERLVAEALATWGGDRGAITVVTKCGMTVPGWIPDGRARSIKADAAHSLAILGGDALDVLLLHAPDPGVPLATSVRALEALRRTGVARRIGLANVNVRELREALELAPITVVEHALSPFDDTAVRGGLVAECAARGILFLAHAPLGGPKRAAKLTMAEAEEILAGLRGMGVVPIPGVTRVETARGAVGAQRKARPATGDRPQATGARSDGEIVMVMGAPASGKSTIAREMVAQGYARLNRDELGGTLRGIAERLGQRLDAGEARFVLDNTYHTRAARHDVLEVGRRRGVPVRGIWLEAEMADLQVNAVERILDRLGELPDPDALARAARKDPQILPPRVLFRYRRELEPPEAAEGFAALESRPFVRRPRPHDRAATVFTIDSLAGARAEDAVDGRLLCVGWTDGAPPAPRPDVDAVLCAHGGGPPRCWCRPPLPGALLVLVRRHRLDPARSTLVGTSAAHRTLAAVVGLRYRESS